MLRFVKPELLYGNGFGVYYFHELEIKRPSHSENETVFIVLIFYELICISWNYFVYFKIKYKTIVSIRIRIKLTA